MRAKEGAREINWKGRGFLPLMRPLTRLATGPGENRPRVVGQSTQLPSVTGSRASKALSQTHLILRLSLGGYQQ